MTAESSPRRSLWQRLALNLVLVGVSLLFAAALSEVAVRVAAPQQLILIRPDLWQPADTFGWLRRPNVNSTINTGERTVRLITDHEGFRIGASGRTEGLPVLLLGDSFVEALQVEHEQSLAGRLETALSTQLGRQAAVRNAGISGWSPGQYLARTRVLLPDHPYRAVVVGIYVGNDVRTTREEYLAPRPISERQTFRLPRALSMAELVGSLLAPFNDAMEVRSHLYIAARTNLEPLRRRTGLSANYFPSEFLSSEAASERWGITADVCRDLADFAAAHGVPTLFVLIPADFQVDRASFNEHVRGFGVDTTAVDLDQPSRRMYAELSSRGLHVVDALQTFRDRHDDGERLYGRVDKHLSPQGHAALADLITPAVAALVRQGLVVPAATASPDRQAAR